MIYLPPLRRLLIPILIFITLIIFYRGLHFPRNLPTFAIHPVPTSTHGLRIPIHDASKRSIPIPDPSTNHLTPPNEYFYTFQTPNFGNDNSSIPLQRSPSSDPNLTPLFQCPSKPNRFTGHIRLPNIVQNISMIPVGSTQPDLRRFWNPTIIALPYWSENQYLVVQRILTSGNHQENVLCEANICYTGSGENATKGEKPCTGEDIEVLRGGEGEREGDGGLGAGGMRCAHAPITLSVPPTPAEHCEGKFATYTDIPGFHDPRIFWSGKGEPLMMVNTQSRYACFGLWLIDLRSLYPPLQKLLSSSLSHPSLDGPLKSYPSLTELTRNPPSTRSPVEKNWLLFFTPNGEAYIHYDLPASIAASPSLSLGAPANETGGVSAKNMTRRIKHGRTFAKLLGNGLTTPNLTVPTEKSCIDTVTHTDEDDEVKRSGHWHQATNALRLVLCNRADTHPPCHAKPENTVFIALVHRKFSNSLRLPMRYERLFMVWAFTPPFRVLGISQYPILLANETAQGWTQSEGWDDDTQTPPNSQIVNATKASNMNATEPYGGRDYWAYFTYTVSLAYAWGREHKGKGKKGDESWDMHEGYLDDEIVLSIGVDDEGGVFGRVGAGDLVQCLKACEG